MGSKKKTKAKAKANGNVNAKVQEEVKQNVPEQESGKSKNTGEKKAEEKKEETADKKPQTENSNKQDVPGWKEIETERVALSVTAQPEKKKVSPLVTFLLVLLGVMLAATVFVLAVFLYDTSKELKTVQTMSGSLQSELELTKQQMERVEQKLERLGSDSVWDKKEVSANSVIEEVKPTATPRPTPEPEVYTVCVDAGHGGYDTGAVSVGEEDTNRQEKDDNLRMAKLLKKELEAYGVKVIMTREDDTFLELYDRTFIANSMDADALISLHRNAYYLNGKMNDRVSGLEIWVHNSRPTDAMQLAGEMLGAMMEVGGMKNRGVKYGSMSDVNENYAINRRAVMTSMIVELGFISNEEDNAALDIYGEAYAKAMATEIYEWLQTLR